MPQKYSVLLHRALVPVASAQLLGIPVVCQPRSRQGRAKMVTKQTELSIFNELFAKSFTPLGSVIGDDLKRGLRTIRMPGVKDLNSLGKRIGGSHETFHCRNRAVASAHRTCRR